MITLDIFIRCIITRATMTKKHKEPNFPSLLESGPCLPTWGHGVWGAGVGTREGGSLQEPAVVGPSLPLGREQKIQHQLFWCHPEPLGQSGLYTSPCATCQRMMQRYPGSLGEALVGWKMPWEKQHLRQS